MFLSTNLFTEGEFLSLRYIDVRFTLEDVCLECLGMPRRRYRYSVI